MKEHTPRWLALITICTIGIGAAVWQFGPMVATAAKKRVAPVFTHGNGIAINGYDPVAYFTAKKPTPGKKAFQLQWKGATWRFANAKHKAKFKQHPNRYAPQYGGYCAWAVSRNYTAPTQPDAWAVVGGKLYLNYNTNIARRWKKQTEKNIRLANKHWPSLHR